MPKLLFINEILQSIDFTHVPPSRYLFQGADLDKCAASDTLDSSSDNASLNHNPECEGSSLCNNESKQPDLEGCKSTTTTEELSLQEQEKASNIKLPTNHQASSITETNRISTNHNETVVDDTNEPLNKKPKLD